MFVRCTLISSWWVSLRRSAKRFVVAPFPDVPGWGHAEYVAWFERQVELERSSPRTLARLAREEAVAEYRENKY